MNSSLPSALDSGLVSCHSCSKVSSASEHRCPRCGRPLHTRKQDSLQRCIALGIAGIVTFIPANVYPVMEITQLGVSTSNNLFDGVALFWETQSYFVAIVIFTASILIPVLKFIALGYLCLVAKGWIPIKRPRQANRIYWLTELVGRWSMIDIFVIAILVGLIQLGNLSNILPGTALLPFSLMVILTMLSANAFDPRLIWDRLRAQTPSTAP